MCPKINNILKSLRNIECGESIQEPRDVFLYQFNNNDPINRIYAKPYMTQISEWMETFNIKEPKRYFDDGGGGIFGAIAMEHDISFDYGRSQRRPRLWRRLKTEPQLFGPNIVFSIDTSNSTFVQESVNLYPITASALRGAGTVENIVVDLLNGSHYLSVQNNAKYALNLNLISSKFNLTQSYEAALRKSLLTFQKHTIENDNESQKYHITFPIQQCEVTFWFGFSAPYNISNVIQHLL